jgi:crossover junction endodeoxyribonuclease RuvC
LAFRLRDLAVSLRQVFTDYTPQVVAVEGVFSKINHRAALQLTHARGVALLLAAEHGVAPVEYAPATVKAMITGHGRAEKEQVACMVQSLLQIHQPFATDDESDALAVALCYALRQNFSRSVVRKPRIGEK